LQRSLEVPWGARTGVTLRGGPLVLEVGAPGKFGRQRWYYMPRKGAPSGSVEEVSLCGYGRDAGHGWECPFGRAL